MIRSSRRTTKVLASITAAVALMAAPASASAAWLPDVGKIKAWWPLAEGSGQKINDWSGYKNHGFLGSTPQADANDPAWVSGIFNTRALSFGGDDFVTIPGTSSLENNKFSISLWTRAASRRARSRTCSPRAATSARRPRTASTTGGNGGLYFYVWDGHEPGPVRRRPGRSRSGTASGTTSSPRTTGRPHRSASTARTSGRLPAARSRPTTSCPNTGTTLGGYVGACDLLFTGDLDQVMIFDKVIPVAEIWQKFGWLLNKPTL